MNDAVRGATFGISAAILFGLATPAAKVLLEYVGPITLAGLLYLGGGVGIFLIKGKLAANEAPFRSSDYRTAGWILVLGGIAAPVLMLWGLKATSATAGSLILSLEAPLTVFLAALLFREHLGWLAGLAIGLVFAGTLILGYLPDNGFGSNNPVAALALAAACLCWAIDNNLTQRLSHKNPTTIVKFKTLGAGTVSLLLGLVAGEPLPPVAAVVAALVTGFLGYGVSILFGTYALRYLGAAREAAYFATAPFVGVLGSYLFLGEKLDSREGIALGLMAAGVTLLLRERHEHQHTHEAIEHEHMHLHDEHHQHPHEGPVTEPHSHWHRHQRLVHSHLHVPDLHHRHIH